MDVDATISAWYTAVMEDDVPAVWYKAHRADAGVYWDRVERDDPLTSLMPEYVLPITKVTVYAGTSIDGR